MPVPVQVIVGFCLGLGSWAAGRLVNERTRFGWLIGLPAALVLFWVVVRGLDVDGRYRLGMAWVIASLLAEAVMVLRDRVRRGS